MAARCDRCARRLPAGARCPADGGAARSDDAEAAVAVPALPASVLGHAVGERLGAGGFATVVAGGTVDGVPVVLKIAHRAGDERFGREADALAAMAGQGAPRLFARTASEDGRPVLVIERLAGATLAEQLAAAGAAPDVRGVLADFAAIARALAGVHARGWLHRDLTPENVFLPGGARGAVLIDFGLATRFGAGPGAATPDDLHTRAGAVVGTLLYMAPEQAESAARAVAASDVYALGAMLHEALAGKPLFYSAGEPARVRHAHASQPAPRLAAVPAAVADLVAACLAKDPAARPTADAVAAALTDAVTATAAAAAAAAATDAAAPAVTATAAATATATVALLGVASSATAAAVAQTARGENGFVARVRADGLLVAFPSPSLAHGVLAAARVARRLAAADAAARLLVHTAPARVREGVRLLATGAALDAPAWWTPAGLAAGASWTADAQRAAGVEPIVAPHARLDAAAPGGAAAAAGVLPRCGRDTELAELTAAATAALAAGTPALVTLLGAAGAGKSRLVAELLARLPAGERLAAVAPPPERSLAVPLARQLFADLERAGPDGATGARLPRARRLAASLLERARRQPLVVVLDDAHWADPLTLDVLELATLDETDAPLVVVAAARPLLVELRPRWGERAARAASVLLGPLPDADARALLGHLLAGVESVPEPALARLVELGQGLPQQLGELVHALEVSGAIRARPGGAGRYLAADELLAVSPTPLARRLAEQALAPLPPALFALAELCAVAGPRQRAAELARAAERLRAAAADAPDPTGAIDTGVGLERLCAAGLLRRVDAETTEWTMPLAGEALEERLPPARRAAAHRALLDTLRPSGAAEAWRARIARHAAAAGDRARAGAEHRALAEAAAAAHRHVQAAEHYGAALAQLADDDEATTPLLAGRAKARAALGRTAEARADLERARAAAARAGDVHQLAELLLDQATLEDWADRWADAAVLVDEAAPLVAAAGDERLLGRLAMAQGRACIRAGRMPDAEPFVGEAVRLAERTGDRETREIASMMLAAVLVAADRVAEAERLLDAAIARCRMAGDLLHLCSAYNDRLWLSFKQGSPAQAVADQRTALQLARELGHVQLERYCTFNLAELLYWRGELGEAERLARRARGLAERHIGKVALDPLLIGRIAAARGDRAEVAAQLDWVRRECPETPGLIGLQRDLLALVVGDAPWDPAPWQRLIDAVAAASQLFELHETLGFALAAAARAGDREAGAAWLARALALGDAATRAAGWPERFIESTRALALQVPAGFTARGERV